jgi:hypothetical protein
VMRLGRNGTEEIEDVGDHLDGKKNRWMVQIYWRVPRRTGSLILVRSDQSCPASGSTI